MNNMAKLIFLKSARPNLANLDDDTQVWLWIPDGKPHFFHEHLSNLQQQGMMLRNLIYVAKRANKGLSYDVLVFMTKTMDYSFFKDKIRVKSRWKKHEFGKGKPRKNGKKPYNDKGKDPSNVWIKEITKNGSPHVIKLDALDVKETFRRILDVATVKNDMVFSNNDDFLQFAKLHGRQTRRINGIPFTAINYRPNIDNGLKREKSSPPLYNRYYIHDSRLPKDGLYEQVDFILTSPPYYRQRDYGYDDQIGQEANYEEYLENLRKVWINCYHYLKEEHYFVLNINNFMKKGNLRLTHWNMIKILEGIGFKYHDSLIWYQPNSRRGLTPKNVCDAKEYLIIVSKGGKKDEFGDRLLRFKQLRGSLLPNEVILHPARFPEELVEYFLKLFTKENDLVLDPFLGSGTVARVSERMNRKWIGFELNEQYVTNLTQLLLQNQDIL